MFSDMRKGIEMQDKTYPWFPTNTDYEKQYVRDRQGTVWLLAHDGGMVTTADYTGQVYSAGIEWLRTNYGPLEEL